MFSSSLCHWTFGRFIDTTVLTDGQASAFAGAAFFVCLFLCTLLGNNHEEFSPLFCYWMVFVGDFLSGASAARTLAW